MRHTVETMQHELAAATRMGTRAEISDLEMLIHYAKRGRYPALSPEDHAEVSRARNRQNQRRYHRGRTRDQDAQNPRRKIPRIGDWIRTPDGVARLVDRVQGDHAWSGTCGCHFSQLTVIPAPSSAPVAPAQGAPAYAEALYQAIWDALENTDWTAVETALRAYEASAPAA